jgi:hypothetical protein
MKHIMDRTVLHCFLPILVLVGGAIGTDAFAQSQAPLSSQGPVLSEVTAAPVPQGSLVSEASTVSFAPKGMPVGVFRLFPTLDAVADYDDNVFLSSANRQSDYFFRETPELMFRPDWSRHALDVYATGSLYQYEAFPLQDHIDWTGGADGRLDIYREISFAASGAYSVEHLANSSPAQPSSAKSPTGFSLVHSNADFSYSPYHFSLYLGGTYDRFVYEASKLVDGTVTSNADRNEDLYSAYVKAAYEFTPGYAMFLQGTDNQADYDIPLDRSGLRRNNNGYVGSAGLDFLLTNLLKGQAFAGFLDQRFKAPLKDVTGITYGAAIDWYPTPLWVFHLTASRALNGTVLRGASAEDDRSVQVSTEYRFRSDIMINGAVTYLDASQDGANRDDHFVTTRLLLGYILNNWMMAEVSDTFQFRTSNVLGQNFNDNVAMIGLKFKE